MIKNREQFERYLLTMLGEPISKVNITHEQLENCINDAIQMFTEFHYEGTVRTIVKQLITPSILRVDDVDISKQNLSGKIIGVTSNAVSEVCNAHNVKSGNHCIYCYHTHGQFIKGELIKINNKLYKLSDCDNFFTQGIIDSHKIKMPDWIIGVTNILPTSQATSTNAIFDLNYQLRLNDFNASQLTQQSLVYFEQAMEHLDLIDFELVSKPSFDFNQYDGWLYPRCNWDSDYGVGDYMIIEAYRSHDLTASKFWNEPWLKQYAVALVKKAFATNLKKYQNVQLPGGITFNGDQLYSEAQTEIDKLEQQLTDFSWPNEFMIG